MGKPFDRVPVGFRGRTLKTVKLLTKASVGAARRTLLGSPGRDSDDEGASIEAAEQLLGELDGLKGLMMKFGQMVSYLDHSLPPRAQRILARLQSESRPMEIAAVSEVIQSELGASPEELFDSFEPVPFAAASIGQVHRAQFAGKPVAVKVQYPGVVEALESDLKTVGRFARVGLMMSAMDGGALVDELRERILQECDYELEAANQALFHRLLAEDGHRSVPPVVEERSGKRVLTSAFVERNRFQEFADEADTEHRDRAGETIFETCFGSIFRHCVFNADPHPGNYLFGPEGEVTFLDFGCLKWFDPDFIQRWKRLALCILDSDRNAFPDRLVDVGLVAKTRGFDWDFQWEALRLLYQPFLTSGPSVFTGEFIERANRVNVYENPNKFKLDLPRDWLFINRLQMGLFSVLAHLGARGDWARLFRAAVESELDPLPRLT